MENNGSQSSLSFFTSNHSRHDSSWIFRGCSFQITCVACLIETLEDKDSLAIRKRKSLTEIILLLSRDDKLIEILKKNARISSHLCQILIGLLESTQVGVFQISLEGIVQIALKTQNDILVREMLETVETKILTMNNYRKTYPYIVLMGKIIDAIPLLGEEIVAHKNKLWKYCIHGLSFPDENVVVALLFLIISVFKSPKAKEGTTVDIKVEIFKKCCENIINGKINDLKLNSLALLQSFADFKVIEVLKLLSIDKQGKDLQALLCNALKKLVLSNDQGLQVGGIQLITKLLSIDNQQKTLSTTFLSSGLAEFLFEALETNNDIVLASLFCCLTELCHCAEFFRGSYSIYGIDSVVSSVIKANNLQNPETLQQGLHVLSSIISKQKKEVPLFNNGTIFDQCLKISQECLKAMEYKVLKEALYLVVSLLRVDQVPLGYDITRLLSPLNGVASVLKRFTIKTVESFSGLQAGTAQELLCQLLEVIHQAVLFYNSYSNKLPSLEETLLADLVSTQSATSLQQFDNFIMKSLDETCITAVMMNYEAITNATVYEILFRLLNIQLQDVNKEKSTALAKKLVMTSFIRISMEVSGRFCKDGSNISLMKELQCFQKHLITNLSSENADDDMIQKFDLPAIPGSPDEYLTLLSQSCIEPASMTISDPMLFHIQCYCVELLYLAFCHQDVILSNADLFRAIHRFVCLNRNLAVLPTIVLKHLLHLYTDIIMTNQGEQQFVPAESQTVIEQQLLKLSPEEFHAVSCSTSAFVLWVYQSEVLSKSFGKDVLRHVLSMTKEIASLCKALSSSSSSSKSAVKDLMSLLISEDMPLTRKVCEMIEEILSEIADIQDMKQVICQVVKEELQKLFLLNQSTTLPEHVLSAILQILLSLQVHGGDDVDMKIFHLVVDILTRSTHKTPTITIAAVNYINVALWTHMRSGRPNIAAVLMSNKAFMYWIQKVLSESKCQNHSEDSTSVLSVFGVCLILLSNLVSCQSRFKIKTSYTITLNKLALLQLLNDYNIAIPRLASFVFWGTILDTKTECFVSFSKENTDHHLIEEDYKVILIYLQNALMNESKSIKNVAMKCLEVFMSCSQRTNHCSSNQWSKVILDSYLFSMLPSSLDSHLVHFCSIMIKAKSSHMDETLATASKVTVKEIPSVSLQLNDQCQLSTLAEHCINFLKQLIVSDLPLAQALTTKQLISWVNRAHELVSQSKQIRNLCFVKIDQLVLPENIVADQVVSADQNVFPEILHKLKLVQ